MVTYGMQSVCANDTINVARVTQMDFMIVQCIESDKRDVTSPMRLIVKPNMYDRPERKNNLVKGKSSESQVKMSGTHSPVRAVASQLSYAPVQLKHSFHECVCACLICYSCHYWCLQLIE